MLSSNEKKEWKVRLHPKLQIIDGFKGITYGNLGLVIHVKAKNDKVMQQIMNIIEEESEELPYKVV